MDVLSSVKLLTGLDNSRDDLLNEIISLTEMRLLNLLGASEVPFTLSYILVEVTIRRFNRIGSEATTSHTVDGESMSFKDDDFDDYLDDIEAYKSGQGCEKMVHFL